MRKVILLQISFTTKMRSMRMMMILEKMNKIAMRSKL
jgi:hypothetical protein